MVKLTEFQIVIEHNKINSDKQLTESINRDDPLKKLGEILFRKNLKISENNLQIKCPSLITAQMRSAFGNILDNTSTSSRNTNISTMKDDQDPNDNDTDLDDSKNLFQ